MSNVPIGSMNPVLSALGAPSNAMGKIYWGGVDTGRLLTDPAGTMDILLPPSCSDNLGLGLSFGLLNVDDPPNTTVIEKFIPLSLTNSSVAQVDGHESPALNVSCNLDDFFDFGTSSVLEEKIDDSVIS